MLCSWSSLLCTWFGQDTYIKFNSHIISLKRGIISVLVSVHSNGFTSESANGFSVYTSKGETKSDLIATMFIKNMELYFPKHKSRKDYTDGDPDKEANFYILKKTNCPAILIENFFMTNFRESKLLMSAEFQDRIVECHLQTILEIENSEAFIF